MLSDSHNKEIQEARNSHNVTKRATVKAMEDIMYTPIPCLDWGFVRVVDYMGDDSAIVQAARVSYGKGTKKVNEDAGLINYLMRHRHTSPFEMCEIKLHIKLPIFVMRQWIRHRTACLAGDVRVTFDLPSRASEGKRKAYHLTIKEIFDRFQPSFNNRADKQRNQYHKRDRVKQMLLRSCNEDKLSTYHTNIRDIWESGIKPIIKVKFSNGGELRATEDHLCFTNKGWLRLGDAISSGALFYSTAKSTGYQSTKPVISDDELDGEKWKVIPYMPKYEASDMGRVRSLLNLQGNKLNDPRIKLQTVTPSGYKVVSLSENGKSRVHFVHRLVLDAFGMNRESGQLTRHINSNRMDNRLSNLSYGSPKDNASDRYITGNDQKLVVSLVSIISAIPDGEEMTYDMEVTGPYHNFLAGGVFVHNSVNEYSARYSILAKEFYVPTIDNLAPQSKTNHQGRASMPLSSAESARVLELLRRDAEQCYDSYQEMINEDNDGNKIDEERDGLARELARMNLNLNYYTECYWKIDLHNLLHFLGLRVDHHAQYEIRVYAHAIMSIVKQWTPLAHAAFVEHRMNGVSLSAKAFQYIRARLNDEMPSREESGMSKTEWNDIHNQFKL